MKAQTKSKTCCTDKSGESCFSPQRKDSPEDRWKPVLRLSEREFEVFLLMAQGMTCKEIACHLFRSIKTIETQQMWIMRKLGLKRQQAYAYAVRFLVDQEKHNLVRSPVDPETYFKFERRAA